MNDDMREQLSAYLDGALPQAERLALESRLAASGELRRKLQELRAVSKTVKTLPKEPLPPGFLARFQARRARGGSPRQDWVLLPPRARGVALALSCGIVALVLWDKTATPPAIIAPRSPGAAKIYDADHAPDVQLNVSGAVAGGSSVSSSRSVGALGAASGSGAAAGRPVDAEGFPAPAALSEEERSARNERLFQSLEREKKKMGIAKVLLKNEGAGGRRNARAAAAPKIQAAAPNLLKRSAEAGPASATGASVGVATVSGRPSPDAGLVFVNARDLASAWILLGFPGEPPAANFAAGRIVLIKPSATKILSATTGTDAITVVYRSLLPNEPSNPAHDRAVPIPLEPKNVIILDATPR